LGKLPDEPVNEERPKYIYGEIDLYDYIDDNKLFDVEFGVRKFECTGVVSEGKIFGDKAIDKSTIRAATIICREDC
jgi:hypothetical protein